MEETYAYPFLPCTLEWGGKRTPQMEGLLDSGSDGVVLPLDVARYLNLTLEKEEKPMKVVAREVARYSANVNLTIGRAGRLFTFPKIRATIPKDGSTPILIGRDPVFKVYRVIFDDARKRFVLEPGA